MKNKTAVEQSDTGLLERLVIVQTSNPAFSGYTDMQGVMRLVDLIDKLGVFGFARRFVDKDYRLGIFERSGNCYVYRSVGLEIVDYVSGKLVDPVGALRAINRIDSLDLYRFRPKKTYSGRRWRRSRYVRRRYVMAIRAQACAVRDREEFEPGIRKGYLQKVRDAFSSPRSDAKDRCWKRHRKTQHK